MRFVNKIWVRGLDEQVGSRRACKHWKKWMNTVRNTTRQAMKINLKLEIVENIVSCIVIVVWKDANSKNCMKKRS